MKGKIAQILAGGVLVVGMVAYGSGLTQSASAQNSFAAYDGQTFDTQPMSTQQQFRNTWGADAANHWVMEHNNALAAAGFPVPSMQSGAQVKSAPTYDNSTNTDNSGNDNKNNDNNGKGDNSDNGDNR